MGYSSCISLGLVAIVYPLSDIVEKNETQKKKHKFQSVKIIELWNIKEIIPKIIAFKIPKKVPLRINRRVKFAIGNVKVIMKFDVTIQSNSSPTHHNLVKILRELSIRNTTNRPMSGNMKIFLSRKVVWVIKPRNRCFRVNLASFILSGFRAGRFSRNSGKSLDQTGP